MFRNSTAWFSASVPERCRKFWLFEGGTSESLRTADYLFSDDAMCPDTLRIFESKYYLWNEVTVFHSLYLIACERRQSVKSVCIGHYVLPPTRVQDELRRVVGRLIWEQDDDQLIAQEEDDATVCSEQSIIDTTQNEVSLFYEVTDYPVNKMASGYVSIKNLPRYSGELSDFYLQHF